MIICRKAGQHRKEDPPVEADLLIFLFYRFTVRTDYFTVTLNVVSLSGPSDS